MLLPQEGPELQAAVGSLLAAQACGASVLTACEQQNDQDKQQARSCGSASLSLRRTPHCPLRCCNFNRVV